MSIFHYISIFVPLTLACAVPYVLRRHGFTDEAKYRWLLYVACVLFFISWYLPSPLIEGRDTSFTTHFVGGGLFTGLLWVYLVLAMHWRNYIWSKLVWRVSRWTIPVGIFWQIRWARRRCGWAGWAGGL